MACSRRSKQTGHVPYFIRAREGQRVRGARTTINRLERNQPTGQEEEEEEETDDDDDDGRAVCIFFWSLKRYFTPDVVLLFCTRDGQRFFFQFQLRKTISKTSALCYIECGIYFGSSSVSSVASGENVFGVGFVAMGLFVVVVVVIVYS